MTSHNLFLAISYQRIDCKIRLWIEVGLAKCPHFSTQSSMWFEFKSYGQLRLLSCDILRFAIASIVPLLPTSTVYRYNKEYKYLYTDSSDQDEGKVSAMRDPNLRALRSTTFRRSGKEESSCRKSCRKSLCCQILTSKKLWSVILISALIVAVKMLIDYEIPYCNAAQKSGCSYNSVWLWDCRPCPQNAVCDGGKMVSKPFETFMSL